jgi:hypothetical protein
MGQVFAEGDGIGYFIRHLMDADRMPELGQGTSDLRMKVGHGSGV